MPVMRPTFLLLALSVGFGIARGFDSTEVPASFESFKPLIGEWRGVGQVRRGSTRGAWKESAEWRYDFSEDTPAIVFDVKEGKHVRSLTVRSNDSGQLNAELLTADDKKVRVVVEQNGNKTTFTSPTNTSAGYRITLTNLNEKRSLLLIEARPATSKVFRRLGEVGYTRAGTRLATSGSNGPECIVTGGKGTIAVTHKGKTYYVCCTGCKQAFDADPEAIIAAATDRRTKESAKD